jgi:Rieske 2Fe-2S family protein
MLGPRGGPTIVVNVEALIEQQPKGSSLLQAFYREPEVFRRDVDRVHLQHWLCVGHVSRVPKPGDFFVFDVADESFLIVRGRDGEVRAFANVCRHRGSHVCYEKEGSVRALVCPYHGWTYDLDGRLRSARLAGGAVDPERYSLKPLHLAIVEGLLLVCCAEVPPDLKAVREVFEKTAGHYGWARAKVAHRGIYSVDANWKLATENYMECYHCAPAHPEFSVAHLTAKPPEETAELRAEIAERAAAMGIEIPEVYRWPATESGGEGVTCFHDAFVPGTVSGSQDGQPVAPLMGDFKDYDGGFTYMDLGPASFFLAYPDHAVMYLFVPREAQRTDMEIVWLVDAEAREGEDYDLARLTWMWDVTSIADKRIIDHNQRGVNSRYYEPGPYLPMEYQAQNFVEWYLDEIRDPEGE